MSHLLTPHTMMLGATMLGIIVADNWTQPSNEEKRASTVNGYNRLLALFVPSWMIEHLSESRNRSTLIFEIEVNPSHSWVLSLLEWVEGEMRRGGTCGYWECRLLPHWKSLNNEKAWMKRLASMNKLMNESSTEVMRFNELGKRWCLVLGFSQNSAHCHLRLYPIGREIYLIYPTRQKIGNIIKR